MGAISFEIKIKYVNSKDCDYFYRFLSAIKNRVFIDFEGNTDIFKQVLLPKKLINLKTSLGFTWYLDEEETPQISELIKKDKELEFEVYGGSDRGHEELVKIVRSASVQVSIVKYFQKEYYSTVNGYNFIWLDNGKLINYETFQTYKNKEGLNLNLEQEIEKVFSPILEKYEKQELITSEEKLDDLNDMDFIFDKIHTFQEFQKYYDEYLTEVAMEKSKKEESIGFSIEEDQNRKKNPHKLGSGLGALLGGYRPDKKTDDPSD